jgi:hypothetical protein
MTKKNQLRIFFTILALASLACGLLNTVTDTVGNAVTGGTTFISTSQLWSDVPRMDGLDSSNLDMPVFAKLLMQTMMGQFLAEGKGSADWIVFTTTKTADDLQNYYTNTLMSANGWENSDASTCFSGSDQGVDQVGLFCVFTKTENSTDIGLMVIAVPDESNSGKNSVFFIRLENHEATPTP